MQKSVSKLKAYLFGFVFILIMILTATWLHDREIILPEIAAMTVGMWVYQEPGWIKSPNQIFLVPSGTAVIGFLVNYLSLAYSYKLLIASALMLIFLLSMHSNLAPALATVFLPIVVDAKELSFLVAIFVTTAVLMLGVRYFVDWQQPKNSAVLNIHSYLFFWLTLAAWIGLTLLIKQPLMGVIPPVMVVFFEVLNKPMYGLQMLGKHIVTLTLAATIGVFSFVLLKSWLMATIVALPLIWLLLKFMRIQLPAAYAFPLLALILPTTMMHRLPYTTLLLSIIFLGIAWLDKKR